MDDAKVAEEFDRRAERQPNVNAVLDAYDSDAVRHGNRLRDYVTRAAVMRVVRPTGADVIMDVGCGVGRLTLPLAARAQRVIGVDVSPKMIEAARARLLREPGGNVEFLHLASLPIPFPDGAADKALAFWALAHMSDERLGSTLKDVHRCLRAGGRFFAFEQVRLATWEKGDIHKQRSVAEYAEHFRRAGYRFVAQERVMRAPSYALGLWNRFPGMPGAFLPLLGVLERLTVSRKPETADYWTAAMTFEH